jgi:hypothetical protein
MKYLLVILLFCSCITTRDRQERVNYRIDPYYKKGEVVYVKPDSLQVTIVSMRRSGAGPVYLVSYKNKWGWITEQVMEFEIFK